MQGGNVMLDLLYPPQCVGCGLWSARGVRGLWCSVCEAQRVSDALLHEQSRVREIDGVSVISVHNYVCAEVAAAIHALKYERLHSVARECARWMVPQCAEILKKSRARCVFVPVPLHRRRFFERGFNQSELLAREIVGHFGGADDVVVDANLLERVKYTAPQALADETIREQQLRGAFMCSASCDPDSYYIIVDDVVTTGSTLRDCIRALRDAGAVQIHAITIASTSQFF